MLDPRFSYDAFVAAADRERLAAELDEALTRRLEAAPDPEREARALVEELRGLGHDLWSFDASIDFQTWCGDWVAPKRDHELVVSFSYRDDEPPSATATFRSRR